MDPSMLKLAAQCAKAKGHTVGKWLEEAITEKREREKGQKMSLRQIEGIGDQPGLSFLHAQREASVAEGFVPALHGSC